MKKLLMLAIFLCPVFSFAQSDNELDQFTKEIDQLILQWQTDMKPNIVSQQVGNMEEVVQRLKNNKLTVYGTVSEFGPDRNIRRDESAKFLATFAINLKGKKVDTKKTCQFSDSSQGHSDLVDIVKKSCQISIFNGFNGKFSPTANIKRSEALVALVRIISGSQKETDTPDRYSEYAKIATDKGILKGYSRTPEERNKPISRGDLGTRIYRAK